MSQYPEDEFDTAGRDRGPEGVHREPRSLLRALAPFLAAIVIVPLLAWGAVSLLAGGDGEDPEAGSTSAPVETTEDPTEEPTADETEEETTQEEETTAEEETSAEEETTEAEEETTEAAEEDVVFTTSISVLNGAGVNGLAGELAGELGAAGFTTVGAADYGAGTPDATTLYYRNADLAATAAAVGEVVGVDNLVELPSATQNVEIAIVLRGDYTGR